MSKWSDALAAAQRALGKDGKLPRPRVDPSSTFPVFDKLNDAFVKSRGDIESRVLELENYWSQLTNTLSQYEDMVDGNDFGLDPEKPEDKKKIADATAILKQMIQAYQKSGDLMHDRLSKLDKVVTDLGRLDVIKLQ